MGISVGASGELKNIPHTRHIDVPRDICPGCVKPVAQAGIDKADGGNGYASFSEQARKHKNEASDTQD